MDKRELLGLAAWQQAEMVRKRQVSARELLAATLEQIELKNPVLLAYCEVREDLAMEAANRIDSAVARGENPGPLCGLPTVIKDAYDAKGFHTTWGSPLLKDNLASTDDITVARLKAAGCVVVGKSNVPEFCHHPANENPLHGRSSNPFDPERLTGGSSGGSAGAMASGMASVATASDGGGSTRCPAALCGVVGLRPSYGRVPSSGPDTLGIVGKGVVTRTVRDTAIQLDVLAGPYGPDLTSLPPPESFEVALESGLKRLRIGWSPTLEFLKSRPEVLDSCEKTLKILEDAGHHVDTLDHVMDDPFKSIHEVLCAAGDVSRVLGLVGDLEDPALGASLKALYLDKGRDLRATEYLAAQARRFELSAQVAPLFETYDVLATPTLPTPAMRHGEDPWPEEGLTLFGDNHWKWMGYLYPFNVLNLPAISIPSARTEEGLPVGFQIIGPRHQEALVLKLAAEVEQLAPWHGWPI